MKRIFVTGASGFIGKELCLYLFQKKYIIRAAYRSAKCDDLSISDYESFKIDSINAQTQWTEGLRGCDCIIHLAAIAHNKGLKNSSEEYRVVNVESVLNLANQAAAVGVSRFIFISSIGVNGNKTSYKAFSENDIPNPNSVYAIAKYQAEIGLQEIAARTGLEVVIVRPPLVYGANAPGNFGSLLSWIKKGRPLPFGAIIYNRRSFISLGNLVDFLSKVIDHPKAKNEIFLVSDDFTISTGEFILKIVTSMNSTAKIYSINPYLLILVSKFFGISSFSNKLIDSLEVDISKAKNIMDWNPPLSIDEGLEIATRELRH